MFYNIPASKNYNYPDALNHFNLVKKFTSQNFKEIKLNDLPKLVALKGTSEAFITEAIDAIKSYPKTLIEKIVDEDYKIILSKTLKDGYKFENFHNKNYERLDKHNPHEFFGISHFSESQQKKFVVVLDKPEIKGKVCKVVNHELGHVNAYADNLVFNQEFLSSMEKDIAELQLNKLKNLPTHQRKMIEYNFIYQNKLAALNEIIADSIAWGCKGGGCYGSSLILDSSVDEYLVKKSFPNVIKSINKFYGDSGLIYTIY